MASLQFDRKKLRGRSFLLGNKQAFSLCLPAASGETDGRLHPHKWFGAYLYGRKFLEAQIVRAGGRLLSRHEQCGLDVTLTSVTRRYDLDGDTYTERFFVPDGVLGIACELTGPGHLTIEPEFDLRFYRSVNSSTDQYACTVDESHVLVSAPLPAGRYDDASERFIPDGGEQSVLYAAVSVVGAGSRMEVLPLRKRARRKSYMRDQRRRTQVLDADHAPLWDVSQAVVYAPVCLHLDLGGTVLYGFGASPDEALMQLDTLRGHLPEMLDHKQQAADDNLSRAHLSTGTDSVDAAYALVLTAMMDSLVAREAVAQDTAMDHPATMILAGNQYFHDAWKRDENIALGSLLTLGFYELARDVIRDTWQMQHALTGRLPQRIRAGEEPPYHSSDGTLWALLRLHQYWRLSGDASLLDEKLDMVAHFFRRSLEQTIDGLLPSGRIVDPTYLWETWMDTPHTPRDGFPIEIQLLWLAVLRRFRPVLAEVDPNLGREMEHVETLAWESIQRFSARGLPADSVTLDGEIRDFITPNPYIAFGLALDLGSRTERAMRAVGRRQLAGRQGIRTLAPIDWPRVFSSEFLEDRRLVRGRSMRSVGKYNYHRGVEWNWLSQFFVEAELKYGDANAAEEVYLRPLVQAALHRGGIGGIGELYDLSGIRGPEFQTWSMAGFLSAVHAFGGVEIDVPEQRISVAPQLPDSWPHLSLRRWYGSTPVDLRYSRIDGTHGLSVRFPDGVPNATLEMCLVLRAGEVAAGVTINNSPATYDVERIAGSRRKRLRLRVPAGDWDVDASVARHA